MSKAKKLIYILIGIVLVLSFVLHLATEGLHNAGFYTLVGFVGAWILILLAKKILPALIQRSEDYEGGNDE